MKKLLMVLSCTPLLCSAGIYQKTDSNGSVIFSDVKMQGAEKVIIRGDTHGQIQTTIQEKTVVPNKASDVTSHQATQATPQHQDHIQNAATPKPTPKPKQVIDYESISIANPYNEQSFWNSNAIGVQIKSQPTLDQSHKIQLFVDDKPYNLPRNSNEFVLYNLTKGKHTINAAILDDQGKKLKVSASVQIIVHRDTANKKRRK